MHVHPTCTCTRATLAFRDLASPDKSQWRLYCTGAIERKKREARQGGTERLWLWKEEVGGGRLERDVGKSVHAPWTGSIAFPIYRRFFLLSLFLLLPGACFSSSLPIFSLSLSPTRLASFFSSSSAFFSTLHFLFRQRPSGVNANFHVKWRTRLGVISRETCGRKQAIPPEMDETSPTLYLPPPLPLSVRKLPRALSLADFRTRGCVNYWKSQGWKAIDEGEEGEKNLPREIRIRFSVESVEKKRKIVTHEDVRLINNKKRKINLIFRIRMIREMEINRSFVWFFKKSRK